jgi:ribosome-binding factor A
MRKTRRTSRVGENVRDALVEVFRHDLKDVRLAMISITSIDVAPDLNFARVYLSGLKEDETREVVKDLISQKGRIRHFLGQRIRLRYTPELDFRFDDTGEKAQRIEEILREVGTKDEDDDVSS